MTTKQKKKTNGKRGGGHPALFKSPAQLKKLIDKYFKECENYKSYKEGKKISNPQIPTIAGLAVALGVDRHTVYNYEKRDEFFHTIKKARDIILAQIERKLVNYNGHVGGTIFYAKNYGYNDRTELEVTKPLEVIIRNYTDESK